MASLRPGAAEAGGPNSCARFLLALPEFRVGVSAEAFELLSSSVLRMDLVRFLGLDLFSDSLLEQKRLKEKQVLGIELWEVLDVYFNVPPVSTKQLSSIEVGMSMFDTPLAEINLWLLFMAPQLRVVGLFKGATNRNQPISVIPRIERRPHASLEPRSSIYVGVPVGPTCGHNTPALIKESGKGKQIHGELDQ